MVTVIFTFRTRQYIRDTERVENLRGQLSLEMKVSKIFSLSERTNLHKREDLHAKIALGLPGGTPPMGKLRQEYRLMQNSKPHLLR